MCVACVSPPNVLPRPCLIALTLGTVTSRSTKKIARGMLRSFVQPRCFLLMSLHTLNDAIAALCMVLVHSNVLPEYSVFTDL